jgi:type IV secretory pathway component VirB8
VPLKERQRQARQERVLMRVATVVLVLTAAAVLVIISLIIATHS